MGDTQDSGLWATGGKLDPAGLDEPSSAPGLGRTKAPCSLMSSWASSYCRGGAGVPKIAVLKARTAKRWAGVSGGSSRYDLLLSRPLLGPQTDQGLSREFIPRLESQASVERAAPSSQPLNMIKIGSRASNGMVGRGRGWMKRTR